MVIAKNDTAVSGVIVPHGKIPAMNWNMWRTEYSVSCTTEKLYWHTMMGSAHEVYGHHKRDSPVRHLDEKKQCEVDEWGNRISR